jgi:hypothetical protein
VRATPSVHSLLSIHAPSKGHGAEPKVLARPLEELERAQRERLVAEDVLVGPERPLLEGPLAPAVELPQRAVGRLDEADVVQVDVVGGLRRGRVALAGGRVVRGREGARRLEEAGAPVRREGDGLLEELV